MRLTLEELLRLLCYPGGITICFRGMTIHRRNDYCASRSVIGFGNECHDSNALPDRIEVTVPKRRRLWRIHLCHVRAGQYRCQVSARTNIGDICLESCTHCFCSTSWDIVCISGRMVNPRLMVAIFVPWTSTESEEDDEEELQSVLFSEHSRQPFVKMIEKHADARKSWGRGREEKAE